MNDVKDILEKLKVEYDLGIIDNGIFCTSLKSTDDAQVISFKWKKSSMNKLIKKLEDRNINITEIASNFDSALYINNTNAMLFITYAVDSHVQLPETLLKHFRTGNYLYFINTSNDKIVRGSARNYNTKFGYYSLSFEEHLSSNYENIMVDIINTILPFAYNKQKVVEFINLNEKINKIFSMALYRNPSFVEEVNNQSTTSCLLDEGYTTENVTFLGERTNWNFIENYTPIVMINETNKGIVTINSFISNLYIDGWVKCMIMPLHPKFAISLIPNEYYEKMVEEGGEGTYIKLNEVTKLLDLNRQLYNFAKNNNGDVIGLKDDLEDLITANNN